MGQTSLERAIEVEPAPGTLLGIEGGGHSERGEAHQLGAGHLHPEAMGGCGDRREHRVGTDGERVEQVARHLGVAADVEPERTDRWTPDSTGDLPGCGDVVPHQPYVVGDQRGPGAHGARARARVRHRRSGIRLQAVEGVPADLGKGPLRAVHEAGQPERGRRPCGEALAGSDGPAQVVAGTGNRARGVDRYERHDVDRAKARVGTMVASQVDCLYGCLCQPPGRRFDVTALQRPQGHHRSVVVRVAVQVEEDGPGRVRQVPEDCFVTPLADVDRADESTWIDADAVQTVFSTDLGGQSARLLRRDQ